MTTVIAITSARKMAYHAEFDNDAGIFRSVTINKIYWAMNKWLQGFNYHVSMSWWIFALAGIIAVLIAIFTVSFQAIRAALANPVKNLKSE